MPTPHETVMAPALHSPDHRTTWLTAVSLAWHAPTSPGNHPHQPAPARSRCGNADGGCMTLRWYCLEEQCCMCDLQDKRQPSFMLMMDAHDADAQTTQHLSRSPDADAWGDTEAHDLR